MLNQYTSTQNCRVFRPVHNYSWNPKSKYYSHFEFYL